MNDFLLTLNKYKIEAAAGNESLFRAILAKVKLPKTVERHALFPN